MVERVNPHSLLVLCGHSGEVLRGRSATPNQPTSLTPHRENFMKDPYEKPTLIPRERLATIVAVPVSSSQA
jgi:hypothetical protein